MTEPRTPRPRADLPLARGERGRPADLGPRLRAEPGTPLYVHLPFCAAKCHYCDFFSVPAESQDRPGMLAAILREAELFAPRSPRTVFLGGGTPSLLSIDELTSFLDALDRLTGFRASAGEVTAECNPESLDRDKARALLDLGVRRLSIGFQSLHDDVLQSFGRVHDVEQSFRAFDAARAAGVDELNVDMIFAVPGQTPEEWRADLERILALGSEHVSAYNLTFEEDTVFRRWLDQGRMSKAPEEVELELFVLTRALMREKGFLAYEVSNFARAGHACEHNLNYWRNGTYLGIGPSAVSKVGRARFGNVKAIGAYVRRVQGESDARHWQEEPPEGTRLAESWWLGLRLAEGITDEEAAERAGLARRDARFELVVAGLESQGLLERSGARWRMTERGLPLADWIAKRFFETLD